jgi:cytochrome P450
LIIILIPFGLAVWRSIKGYSTYRRAIKVFGRDKVLFFNRSFEILQTIFKKDKVDSLVLYTEALKKHPDTRLIITAVMQSVYIVVCDTDIIGKVIHEFSGNMIKWSFMIFQKELDESLLFSDGKIWKKSRTILSNLFHFGMLRDREGAMREAVIRQIQDLDKKDVDLFKMGCTIGGEIVIDTLFGKEFNQIRFDKNTPL